MTDSMEKEQSIRGSSFSAMLVMICTLISRILGFIRIALISAIFGASGNADVLNTVFTIPNNLRKLLAEGALSSAFIPVLSSILVKEESSHRSRNLVRKIITFQLVILVPFSILCVIFADPLIRFVLVEFDDPALMDLSIRLFRWFIHYLLLISISAVLMGVLNSHYSFVIPAITPILFSIAVITSVLMLHKQIGIFSMAVGILGGGLMQVLFQSPLFRRFGYDFKLDFTFRDPDFKRIIRGWLPVVATASVFAVNQQIAARFATGLETGSSSALQYALVFFQLPFGIFSASITTVLFPRMSRQAASRDLTGLRDSIQYGIRFLLILLIPSTLFLTVMGREIISVALFRGAFTLENTLITSRVLFAYALGLFSVGAFTFFQRFYYALSDYRTPFFLALIVCATDVLLSIWLKSTYLRVIGLALANSISFTLGLLLMIFRARRKIEYFESGKILLTFGKVIISVVPALIYLLYYRNFTGPWWEHGSSFLTLGLLTGGAVPAILSIVFMFYLLKVEIFFDMVKKRLKK